MTVARALVLTALATTLPAGAQNPAPALAAPAGTAAAAAPGSPAPEAPMLGRLFFTPAERARLDELRRRPPPPPQPVTAAAQPESPPAPPSPQYVTLNGIVRRSDGATTVWLNNKPVTGPRSEEGLVVTPSGRSGSGNVTVRVPETGRSIDLKVGQQVEVRSGQVQEAYESPRAVAAASAAAETRAPEPTPAPTVPRRSNRERDLLRDLLREIEGPASASAAGTQASQPAPAANASTRFTAPEGTPR
jgi:hypothetical protein